MSPALRILRHTVGAPNLIVMLPGAYMTPEDYEQQGFFSAIARRRLPLDLVAVDLDLSVISAGTALPALQAEILEPARVQGYKKIWLGGISLGGLLALCHNADQPGGIDGLCLLAPYPGSRLTTNAIARAGGMRQWQPSADEMSDPEFRAWHWLQNPPAGFPVYVGYGREDRFAEGMKQIADCFPLADTYAIPGRHEWSVWQLLWEHFLDCGYLSA